MIPCHMYCTHTLYVPTVIVSQLYLLQGVDVPRAVITVRMSFVPLGLLCIFPVQSLMLSPSSSIDSIYIRTYIHMYTDVGFYHPVCLAVRM